MAGTHTLKTIALTITNHFATEPRLRAPPLSLLLRQRYDELYIALLCLHVALPGSYAHGFCHAHNNTFKFQELECRQLRPADVATILTMV